MACRGPAIPGLVHATAGESGAYVAMCSIWSSRSPRRPSISTGLARRQVPERQKELLARVAALKAFLGKNPPPDRHLVQTGPEYPVALVPEVELKRRPHRWPAQAKNR